MINAVTIFSGLVVLVGIVLLIILLRYRKHGLIIRSLNTTLYSIVLPSSDGGDEKEDEHKNLKDMEQFLTSFMNLKAKGIKAFLYGQPYTSFELAVHHKGDKIMSYVAVPRSLEGIFQKQVHGVFPYAEVKQADDYNIFTPGGFTLGSWLKTTNTSLLPLTTYEKFSIDPLSPIVTAMSKIAEDGEGVAVQYVLRPADYRKQRNIAKKVIKEMQKGHDFHRALSRVRGEKAREVGKILSTPAKDATGAKSNEIDPSTVADEAFIKELQDKITKHHFSTNIRLLVSAETEVRAEQIMSELESAYQQFNNPVGNSLYIKRVKRGAIRKFVFNYSFRIPEPKRTCLLSTEEIVGLFHLSLSQAGVPGYKTLKGKILEPPSDMPREGIILGENEYRGVKTVVRMDKEDRRRHLYSIGQTGTGKTTLFKNMIKQDVENGEGLAVIDPHGELAEYVLSIVPEERKQDIVWFDPGDLSRPFGLNMLEMDPSKPEQKTLVVNELLGIFKKLFLADTMGPVFDQYFRNSVLLLLDDYAHEIPTLLDIPRVLTDSEYRADKLSRETNEVVKSFWEGEAEKAKGEASLSNIAPYITSKINGFVADEFLKPIISQQQSSLNFREAMDNQKIILVNLSKGKLGDLNSNLIGLVVIGKLLMAALSRTDTQEETRKDFYLYIDEFQNVTTDSIASILSEARKYKLNLIIAHQFIKQLQDEIRDAVFGNVGSIVAFRVGAEDAEFMENHFAPKVDKKDLIEVDNLKAYVKMLVNGKTTKPFNMKLILPPRR
ncbi:type IV secretion system DNA-binding domain-containing protein [Patescibacteria group bacterium]|nr:type IV secretion system DNA-binding domain-containing protein [Patescibacteria group bacterium]